MSLEKKRRPVFQESGFEEPIKIDPPFQPAEEVNEEIESIAAIDDFEVPAESLPPVEPVGSSVLPFDWKEITSEQHDGKMYRVACQYEEEGVNAFWRKTRVLSHNKWAMHGKWTNSLTRVSLSPQPLYYKGLA